MTTSNLFSAPSPFSFSSSSISSSAPASSPSFGSAFGFGASLSHLGSNSVPAFSLGSGSGSALSPSPSLFVSSTPFGASSSSPSLFASSTPFGASSSSSASTPSLSTSTPLFGASSSSSSSSTSTPLFGASSSLFSSSASAPSFSTSTSLFGSPSSSSFSTPSLFVASTSTVATAAASSAAASTPSLPSFSLSSTTSSSSSSSTSSFSFGFSKTSSPAVTSVTATTQAPASQPAFGFGNAAPTKPISSLSTLSSSAPSLSKTTTTSATPAPTTTSLFSSQTTASTATSTPSIPLFSSAPSSFSSSTTTAIATTTPAVTSTAATTMTSASTPSLFQSTSPSPLFGTSSSMTSTLSASSTTTPLLSSTTGASSSGTAPSVSLTTSQAPKLPSEIAGKTVEEIIKDWNSELQERTAKFRKHAMAIAEWDKRILHNRDVLIRLETDVAKVVDTQTSLEQQLELIETNQQEVDKALQSMEEEAEHIYENECGLLLEDEAAFARDSVYEQAEFIESEMQNMAEQIKSIIETVNAKQGGDVSTIDSMMPIDVVVRILNNQLSSLMWIDEASPPSSINVTNIPISLTATTKPLPDLFESSVDVDATIQLMAVDSAPTHSSPQLASNESLDVGDAGLEVREGDGNSTDASNLVMRLRHFLSSSLAALSLSELDEAIDQVQQLSSIGGFAAEKADSVALILSEIYTLRIFWDNYKAVETDNAQPFHHLKSLKAELSTLANQKLTLEESIVKANERISHHCIELLKAEDELQTLNEESDRLPALTIEKENQLAILERNRLRRECTLKLAWRQMDGTEREFIEKVSIVKQLLDG